MKTVLYIFLAMFVASCGRYGGLCKDCAKNDVKSSVRKNEDITE